jgi:hypothetical protein
MPKAQEDNDRVAAANGGLLTGKSLGFVKNGSAITQATNRTTGVTINAPCGQITTNTASLAAETTAKFTVTNNKVAATDVVVVSQQSGSNSGGTDVFITATAAGSFEVAVQNGNVAAGTAETGAIVINFVIIKAVAS